MSNARYVPMKRAIRCEDDWWPESRERMDVIIASDDPVDTGLVDQHGIPIMRLPAKSRLGFCR